MNNGAIAPHFMREKCHEVQSILSMSVNWRFKWYTSVEKKWILWLTGFMMWTLAEERVNFGHVCVEGTWPSNSIINFPWNLLSLHGISWINCVGIGVEYTNGNLAGRNSMKRRVKERRPSCYFMGCPCHSIHNIARDRNNNHKGSHWGIIELSSCYKHYREMLAQ